MLVAAGPRSRASASAPSPFRSASNSSAPSAARRRAQAAPMPLAAPVISTLRPASRSGMRSLPRSDQQIVQALLPLGGELVAQRVLGHRLKHSRDNRPQAIKRLSQEAKCLGRQQAGTTAGGLELGR